MKRNSVVFVLLTNQPVLVFSEILCSKQRRCHKNIPSVAFSCLVLALSKNKANSKRMGFNLISKEMIIIVLSGSIFSDTTARRTLTLVSGLLFAWRFAKCLQNSFKPSYIMICFVLISAFHVKFWTQIFLLRSLPHKNSPSFTMYVHPSVHHRLTGKLFSII